MTKQEFIIFLNTRTNTAISAERYVKKHYQSIYFDIMTFTDFPIDFTFAQKLYHYINNDELKLGLCSVCGKRTRFKGIFNGYCDYCSHKCSLNSNERKESVRETWKNKSSDEKQISENKRKHTCLEKYGCENPSQSDDVKNKKKHTCLEKYGVEYFTQTDDFKQNFKNTEWVENRSNNTIKTCLEKYGVEHPMKLESIKNKVVFNNTNKSYLEKQDILKKIKLTKLERYDDENYNNTEKRKETCLEKYAVDNPMKSDIVKKKYKDTCLKLYGKEYYLQTSECIEKSKLTCLEKYGCDNYSKTNDNKEKYKNPEYVKLIQDKIYQTKKKNNSFNTSKIEEQIKLYLDSLGVNYEYQYTSEVYPFNCDFYFPDKDLYVEIQGSWTHGPRPFTGSDEDMLLLEKWKSKNTDFYNAAIETWTVRDVRKREIAKQNNLNYLEIFSCDLDECVNNI